jgi:hypothetical protein
MFPLELEANAFRAGDEFGWTRAQIPLVINVLRSERLGILGGELWWVNDTGEIVPGLVESGGSRLSARYATCSC